MIEHEHQERGRPQQIVEKQASFTRGYSPLYAAMLQHIGRWLADPGACAQRLGQPGLVGVAQQLAAFLGRSDWNNDLEPTLRLAACLHAHVLDADPRMDDLRAYYRTAAGTADPTDDRFEHRLSAAVVNLGAALFEEASRWRVRTNETSRGLAWLLPAVLVGAEAAYLVELGASAGLNLYAEQRAWTLEWDDGSSVRVGRAADEQFRVPVTGSRWADLPAASLRGPEVLGRVGCDTDPVDAADSAAARVLAACVWGDQAGRLARLREGLEIHRRAREGAIAHVATVRAVTLPDDLGEFLARALPAVPKAPVISFNTYVTAYLNDVDQREVARHLSTFARAFSLQHRVPWMWVRFEPPRSGEDPAPEPGWCRWRVELWQGTQHRRIELGWAHPHLVRARFGPGLLELAGLRESE